VGAPLVGAPCGRPACGRPACGRLACGHPPCGRPLWAPLVGTPLVGAPCGRPPCGRPACGRPACGRPACGYPACGRPARAGTSPAPTVGAIPHQPIEGYGTMFTLREYQQHALDALRQYFRTCVQLNSVGASDAANVAFYQCTLDTFGVGLPYNPIPELAGLPYVLPAHPHRRRQDVRRLPRGRLRHQRPAASRPKRRALAGAL